MTSRALHFPAFTLGHLTPDEAPEASELATLSHLELAGFQLGLLALPAAIEDTYYRLGGLPARIPAHYRGLDPADPDEDILEEAWEALEGPLAESYLLDEVVDALFDAFGALLARATGPVTVRRSGEPGFAVQSPSRRALLLALKRAYREEWTPARVTQRLQRTGNLTPESAPVIFHHSEVGRDDDASEAAARFSNTPVEALTDDATGVVRLRRLDRPAEPVTS